MKKAIFTLAAFCLLISVSSPSWSGTRTKSKSGPAIKKTVKPASKRVKKGGIYTHKPGPDLIVSIQASHSVVAGDKISSCKVTVKNIGTATAPGTQTAGANGYVVDLTLSSDGFIPVAPAVYSPHFSEDVRLQGGRISNTPDLAPGSARVFNLSNVLRVPSDTPPKGYCLAAVVDPGKRVPETNENNNTYCSKLKVRKKALPDLVVSDISLVKECWIKVTVRNIGAAGLPNWVYSGPQAAQATIQMYKDGGPWGGMAIKVFDPAGKLKTPGASVTGLWFKGSPGLELPSGAHTVKVIVDSSNKVDESNDTNNTLTRRLRCRATGQ